MFLLALPGPRRKAGPREGSDSPCLCVYLGGLAGPVLAARTRRLAPPRPRRALALTAHRPFEQGGRRLCGSLAAVTAMTDATAATAGWRLADSAWTWAAARISCSSCLPVVGFARTNARGPLVAKVNVHTPKKVRKNSKSQIAKKSTLGQREEILSIQSSLKKARSLNFFKIKNKLEKSH